MKTVIRFFVCLSIVMGCVHESVLGQTIDVTNAGTLIYIQKDAVMSIGGSYIDMNSQPMAYDDASLGMTLDAPIFLSGTLYIAGDIYNYSGTQTKLIFEFENKTHTGKVILNGASQIIGGNVNSYFPNLTLASTGTLTLQQSIKIDNNLTMVSGKIDMASDSIQLANYGVILNETATNNITGTNGVVNCAPVTINPDTVAADYRGIGFGYKMGLHNIKEVVIDRIQKNASKYNVGDNRHTLRVYKLTTTTDPLTDELEFDEVKVEYNEAELNSLSESDLALYVSNDNGSTWLKAGVADPATNTVTSDIKVPLSGPYDASHPNNINLFALAVGTCVSNRPVASIRSSGVVAPASINVCEENALNLSLDPVIGGTYYEMSRATDSNVRDTLSGQAYSIASVQHADQGNYYSLVRNAPGCVNTDVLYVDVRDKPEALFVTSDPGTDNLTECRRDLLNFVDQSSTNDGTMITGWSWAFDDLTDSTSNSQNPTFAYVESSDIGLQQPSLTVTTSFGCASNSYSVNLFISELPVPAFSMHDASGSTITEICEDLNVTYRNQSSYLNFDGSSSSLSYRYRFGDGSVSYDYEPVHAIQTHGTYTIWLQTTANTTGCYDSISHDLIVKPEPVPLYTAQVAGMVTDEACVGVDVLFSNTTTMPDATPVTYQWTFDGGNPDNTATNPELEFASSGKYHVELRAFSTTHGCFEEYFDIDSLTIHPPPVGDFTIADPDICLDEQAQFTNNSSIEYGTITYQWSFGDGNTSTSAATDLAHTYALAKSYNVKLSRTSDEGCTNSFSRTLIVHPMPVPMFSNLDECDRNAVQFYNMSDIQSDVITSYSWTFGDGNASSEEDPSHKFATYGLYDVTVAATSDYGCSADFTSTVEIFQRPSFDLGAMVAGCDNQYLIDPTSGSNVYIPNGTIYQWRDINNNILGNSTTLQVTQEGVYRLKLTESHGCDSTINIPVKLFLPVSLGDDIVACDQAILDAESLLPGEKLRASSTTYQWTKNGAPYATTQSIIVTEPGTYGVTVVRTSGSASCASYDEVNIDIELPLAVSLLPEVVKCEGETLTLDPGFDADSFQWTNLDTGEPLATSRTLDVTTGANYKVEVVRGSCSAQMTTQVIFTPPPSVSFTALGDELCNGKNILFKDYSFTNGDTITNLQWDFGDNTTSSGVEVTKSFASSGDYTVALTATTAGGCSNTYQQAINIKEAPVANFIISDGCENELLSINNLTTPSDALMHWSFGDGTEADEQIPLKSYSDNGNYDVVLTVLSNGCISTVTKMVTINAPPEFDFGNEVTTCGTSLMLDAQNVGSSFRWFDPSSQATTLSSSQQYLITSDQNIGVEITNPQGCTLTDITSVKLNTTLLVDLGLDSQVCDSVTLYPGYLPGATVSWSTGENSERINVTATGNFSVNVTDQNGCNAFDEVAITVIQTPAPTLEYFREMCAGDQLTLNPLTDASLTYAWSSGATSPTLTVSSGGTYEVTVSNGMCSNQALALVSVHEVPTSDFSATSVCAGLATTFSNTSTGSGALQYIWTFDDGTFSALEDPSKQYATGGSYSVSLKTINAMNCASEITKTVTVHSKPVASFEVLNGCTEAPISISNTSSYDGNASVSYHWDFENGDTYDGMQPAYTYNAANTYYIKLTATTSEGCVDTYLQGIFIGTTPSLSQWQNTVESCNEFVVLDAGNAGSTYLWSDNSTNQNLTVDESGDYTVTITSPDGCVAVGSSSVSLSSPASPQINENYEGCGSVMLDPLVNAATYLWSTGAQTKTINAQTTGEYWIQVVTDQLCIGKDTTQVNIFEIPVFTLGNDLVGCDGNQFQLQAVTSVPVTYLWSTTATTPSITVMSSGTYSLKLTSDRGCEYSDAINVLFNPVPVIAFPDNITSCGNYVLNAGNPGSTYLWSNGSTSPTLNVLQSGSYSVTVTTAKNCSSQDQVNVTINTLPLINLGNDQTLCHGQTTTLDAGNFTGAYKWSDNSTGRYLQVGSSGTYSVTLTDGLGCSATDQVSITIRPNLGLELGEDRLLCGNGGLFLSAGVNNVSYAWGSNTGLTATTKEIRPTLAGTYWVFIRDAFNCTASDTVNVTPTTENITASFLVPSVVNRGDLVHFAMLTEPAPTNVLWDFGDGGTSTQINPSHPYYRTGDFNPMLIVSNGVCSDTLTKVITVRDGRFATDPEVNLPELIQILNATQFPNPTNGLISLQLELSTEAEAWITVISLKGITITEQRKKTLQETFEFDITPEANGIYLLRIVVDKNMKVLKVLKAERY
jgi:PKD repeat protein